MRLHKLVAPGTLCVLNAAASFKHFMVFLLFVGISAKSMWRRRRWSVVVAVIHRSDNDPLAYSLTDHPCIRVSQLLEGTVGRCRFHAKASCFMLWFPPSRRFMCVSILELDPNYLACFCSDGAPVSFQTAAASTISAMKKCSKASLWPGESHLRKGGSGGWRDIFTVREAEEFDKLYLQQMEGTGLQFDFGEGLVM